MASSFTKSFRSSSHLLVGLPNLWVFEDLLSPGVHSAAFLVHLSLLCVAVRRTCRHFSFFCVSIQLVILYVSIFFISFSRASETAFNPVFKIVFMTCCAFFIVVARNAAVLVAFIICADFFLNLFAASSRVSLAPVSFLFLFFLLVCMISRSIVLFC